MESNIKEGIPTSNIILITPPDDKDGLLLFDGIKTNADENLENKENEHGTKIQSGVKLRPKKGKRDKDNAKRVSFADLSNDGELVQIHDIETYKNPEEEDAVWLACENINEMGLLDRKCQECSLSEKGIECKPELSICFEDPSSNTEFLDVFKDKVISLARCRVRHRYILGIALVKKVTEESSVFARHSFDNWKTYEDIHATNIPNHNNVDIAHFAFILEFPKDSHELEFAICHKFGNDENWDNRDGLNYKIEDLNYVLCSEDV